MSSIATSQEDEETQRREDLTLSYSRLFDGPLFATASAAAQTNDELGLDLRVSVRARRGHQFVRSNSNDLISIVGLSVNREWSSDGDGRRHQPGGVSSSVEALGVPLRLSQDRHHHGRHHLSQPDTPGAAFAPRSTSAPAARS